uniref:EGF-like domain-containing protein n=1 Tax=Anopheles merus TaxID=30066 RepID=A0A182VD83_ANOME
MLGTPPNCRPECETDQDCPSNRACFNQKCRDPCVGSCGYNAQCSTRNHRPECYCVDGFEGDPYSGCNPVEIEHTPIDPCRPSPCGPYSQCRNVNEHAVCSCQANYIGSPPACRPECTVSSECALDKACIKQSCLDPCPAVPPVLPEIHSNDVCQKKNKWFKLNLRTPAFHRRADQIHSAELSETCRLARACPTMLVELRTAGPNVRSMRNALVILPASMKSAPTHARDRAALMLFVA